MKQFIPANLDFEDLLKSHPPTSIKSFKKDALIHCLHLIFSIPANNKDLEIIRGYVPMYSKILKARIRNYKAYLTYLEQRGVIECNNQYIVGERSKGYRFKGEYCRGIKEVEITDRTLIRHQKATSYYSDSMKQAYYHLMHWFDEHLEIDYDLAMDYITTDRRRKLENPDLCDYYISTGLPKSPYNQYYSSYINIQRIADKDFFKNVDTNVYRLHSNLTNIRSALRNCLTYKGENLVSVDICNSQPYISTVLMNEAFWGVMPDKQICIHISELGHNTLQSLISINDIKLFFSSIMCRNSDEALAGKDIQRYTDIVVQGRFYESLERIMGDELGVYYSDRKEVKVGMFQVLFTSNKYIGQYEARPKRLFRELFPKVYELFSIVKKIDQTILPRLLQRIESELILKRITKRISIERPKLPIFTIHDSIATTIGNETYVKAVMEDELQRAIGYFPKLNIERWLPTEMRFKDKTPFLGEEELKVA